jgi:hypothetical protein
MSALIWPSKSFIWRPTKAIRITFIGIVHLHVPGRSLTWWNGADNNKQI